VPVRPPQDGPAAAGAHTEVSAVTTAPSPGGRRPPARPVPQRSEAFAHLTLEGLRAYRKALAGEEDRVSYWRRVLQARLDVLRAGTSPRVAPAVLRPVLADTRGGASRTALVSVVPDLEVAPLPDLAELWDREVADTDAEGRAELAAALRRAEEELSLYRASLHERISDATRELVARYREDPRLCLSVLPLPPQRAVAEAAPGALARA